MRIQAERHRKRWDRRVPWWTLPIAAATGAVALFLALIMGGESDVESRVDRARRGGDAAAERAIESGEERIDRRLDDLRDSLRGGAD